MIETFDLCKSYGQITAVDHVSIHVPAGVICGLVGPDGAGKTTLMRMLCNLIEPDSGEIKAAPATAGYMPQRFSLYGDLTIMENISFLGSLYGLGPKTISQRACEILTLTGLSDFKDRLAANLSGGMKQKLALTCALIARPQLLLLDEPTYGVDPESRKEFWKILYHLNQEGMTILVSTPYMDEAELCNLVFFINKGNITTTGSPLELRQQFSHHVLTVQIDCRDPFFFNGVEGLLDVSFYGSGYRLVTDDPEQVRLAVEEHCLARNIKDISVKIASPTMEDVFVFLAEMEGA